MLLFIFILLVACGLFKSSVNASQGGINETKNQDLIILNECFTAWGSPEKLTGGWGGNGPVCKEAEVSTWKGVTCGNGSVVALILNYTMLDGTLPRTIGGISTVTHITMDHNKLTGSLPDELFSLTQLVYLDLSFNMLNGKISPKLSEMKSLKMFGIWGNNLDGTLPALIGDMTSLLILDLGSNSFTGSIPASVAALHSLQVLNLPHNRISGELPSAFGFLTSLQHLNVMNNHLEGTLPSELALMKSLSELNLMNNRFQGTIGSELTALKQLTSFGLSANYLTGPIPPSVSQMTWLKNIRFERNSLSGSIPSSLGSMTALLDLDLRGNKLTGSIPPQLGGLTSLTYLDLGTNELTREIPSQLSDLRRLSYLRIASNRLSGSLPTQLNLMTALTQLDIGFNLLLSGPLIDLGALVSLTHLDLSLNRLAGPIPPTLGLLSGLTLLGLNNNLLTGIVPESLCRLDQGTIIRIQSNKLSCYPKCLSGYSMFSKSVSNGMCTSSPTRYPTLLPTLYPTNTNTEVPAQRLFASFKVSQLFACIGTLASMCSDETLYEPALIATNSRLWIAHADKETNWLTQMMIDDGTVVNFNKISSAAGGYLVSYQYTFRPIDLKMSSMEAVRHSFQMAIGELDPVKYSAELYAVLQLQEYAGAPNPLSSSTLNCTSTVISQATPALGAPTAFPTVEPKILFTLSDQIALSAAALISILVSVAVWYLRAGLHMERDSERIVAFKLLNIMFSISITIMTFASNILQIKSYFEEGVAVGIGAVMMASRIGVAIYGGILLYLLLYRESFNVHLVPKWLHYSTLWVIIAAVALLDPTHLRFFPFKHSEFAERSGGFPTVKFFKLALGCTAANSFVQLSVSAAKGSTFSSIASLVLSLVLFAVTMFTIVVKLIAEKIQEHDLTLLSEVADLEAAKKRIVTAETRIAALVLETSALRAELVKKGSVHEISMVTIGVKHKRLPMGLSVDDETQNPMVLSNPPASPHSEAAVVDTVEDRIPHPSAHSAASL